VLLREPADRRRAPGAAELVLALSQGRETPSHAGSPTELEHLKSSKALAAKARGCVSSTRLTASRVVIGDLARVVHGSDETTRGVGITPALSERDLTKIQAGLRRLNAQRRDGQPLDLADVDPAGEPLIESTPTPAR
jgi:hypothetical protein